MLEGIICPVCENTLEEVDLRDSLVCLNCRTDLKDRQYLDFLEFLMANGIDGGGFYFSCLIIRYIINIKIIQLSC